MQEPTNADELLRGPQSSHDRESGLAHNTGIAQPSPTSRPPPQHPVSETRGRKCRYFFSSGCKAGAACVFSHDASAKAAQRGQEPNRSHRQGSPSRLRPDPIPGKSEVSHEMSRPAGTGLSSERSRIASNRSAPGKEKNVARPVPESQKIDQRQFQLNQLRRRFSPAEEEGRDAMALRFKLMPTDPDFPFELTDLQCMLLVPNSYPSEGRPSLRVTNPEMDRGYQINVERGFDSLVTAMPKSTLLALINELDKRLESFLTTERAQTVKLVTNIGMKTSATALKSTSAPAMSVAASTMSQSSLDPPPPEHSPQQRAEAKAKRESDIRQLEARMGRQPLFAKSSDGLSLSVPLPIAKSSKLPHSLQSVKSVKLFVPLSYNVEPCSVLLVDVSSDEADAVQSSFERYARANPDMTLMAHINHLAQNIHTMAMTAPVAVGREVQFLPPSPSVEAVVQTPKGAATNRSIHELEDRPHVQVVPRPPEWGTPRDDKDQSDSSGTDTSDDESSEHESGEDNGGAALPPDAQEVVESGPDLGILLSFPSLELYGAELLQLYSVSLTVKCDRCKDTKDVKNIRPHVPGDGSMSKHESCNKCANQMGIGYRSEPMHSSSVRAGYLDLDGCTTVDLLPSNFIPICSQCSTPYSAPGVVSFRGESTMAMCRDCHQKMSFRIPDVKFLRVSAAGSSKHRPLARKRPKENLGIISGQELPRRGRCEHYAKSYRWFRFSCCVKVYPCDRCHDAAEEHPNEHANRMICGFCSREQIYRPEDCIHCHHSLVRKHGGGFWEGGKGTRDKVRMNRKDPRKYKRRPGGAVVGGEKGKAKK